MSPIRSLWVWAREDRTWPVFAFFSLFIVGLNLAIGTGVVSWVPPLVALWAGFVLAHVAFRLLGWQEPVANLIWGAAFVVVVALLLVPSFLFGSGVIGTLPTWARVVYWAASTLLVGFGGAARAIIRQRTNAARR